MIGAKEAERPNYEMYKMYAPTWFTLPMRQEILARALWLEDRVMELEKVSRAAVGTTDLRRAIENEDWLEG